MPMYTVQANCIVDKFFHIIANSPEEAIRKAEKGIIYHEEEIEMRSYKVGDVWTTSDHVAKCIKDKINKAKTEVP